MLHGRTSGIGFVGRYETQAGGVGQMIDWNDLKYVMALRDGKTIKHAAELLKTNPTTVSRHIKKLSGQLGSTLFLLSKSGDWHITPKGEKLCQIAQNVRANLDHLVETEQSSLEEETVVVTSLEFLLTHFVARHLGRARRAYPHLNISLRGSDRRLSLAYGEADIALRFGRPQEGQLLASKVAEIEFDVFHAGTSQPSRNWVGLHEDLDWTPEMQMGFETFGGPPSIRVTSFSAAREAAFATNYATIGPAIVMEAGGKLRRSAILPGITREVWSVIHESRRTSESLQAIRECLKVSIQKSLREHRAAAQLSELGEVGT